MDFGSGKKIHLQGLWILDVYGCFMFGGQLGPTLCAKLDCCSCKNWRLAGLSMDFFLMHQHLIYIYVCINQDNQELLPGYLAWQPQYFGV